MTPHVSITLLRTQTDERLVELIAAGHDRAFDAVVDRYRRPLLRYARRFLHEEARAEDVVQSAFVSAWAALREGTTVRDLRPWLYRIVHNGALNVIKKPGGEDVPLIEASDLRPGPALEVEQREDVRLALDTIAGLPERQRAALLAVALEGRSHADVGVELGLNDNAVRQLVRRARVSLRVAATAITPWPTAVWLAGLGSQQAGETATRIGEVVGGVGAGTLFGGGAMKAGAVIAAAGAVAVATPQVAHVVHHKPRPVTVASAEPAPARSGSGGSAAASASAARTAPASSTASRRITVSGPAGTRSVGGERARHERSGGDGRSGPTSHSRSVIDDQPTVAPLAQAPVTAPHAEAPVVAPVPDHRHEHSSSETRSEREHHGSSRTGERESGSPSDSGETHATDPAGTREQQRRERHARRQKRRTPRATPQPAEPAPKPESDDRTRHSGTYESSDRPVTSGSGTSGSSGETTDRERSTESDTESEDRAPTVTTPSP